MELRRRRRAAGPGSTETYESVDSRPAEADINLCKPAARRDNGWSMFRVLGEASDGHRTATRLAATSAAVLAMKWIAKGTQNVMIEADGRAYELRAFRARYIMPLIFQCGRRGRAGS